MGHRPLDLWRHVDEGQEAVHRDAHGDGATDCGDRGRGVTDLERQRRLSVENRLLELRTKHGRDLEDVALPDWLDSHEGFLRQRRPVDESVTDAPARVISADGRVGPAGFHVNGSPVAQSVDLGDLDV